MRILSITANGSRAFATSIVAVFVVLAAFPASGGPGPPGRRRRTRRGHAHRLPDDARLPEIFVVPELHHTVLLMLELLQIANRDDRDYVLRGVIATDE